MKQTLQELWKIVQNRLQSAQQRVQEAGNKQMARYYKGQTDALHVVLRDIESAKFELGIELDKAHFTPKKKKGGAGKSSKSGKTASDERTPQKSRRGRKPRSGRIETPKAPHEILADRAVAKGVITRSSSHFLHDLLPKGHAQGFYQLYEAFGEDENLRQAIQKELEQLESQETQEAAPSEETA